MAVIDAIVSNFFGYDLIIIIIAFINGLFFVFTKSGLNRFNKALYYRPNDLALRKKNEEVLDRVTDEDLKEIKKTRSSANRWYTLFGNMITIFPLLGLLGTVLALMNVASGSGFENIQYSFMVSLTSTFWGMIFAIIFKLCDSLISADMEICNIDATRVLTVQED